MKLINLCIFGDLCSNLTFITLVLLFSMALFFFFFLFFLPPPPSVFLLQNTIPAISEHVGIPNTKAALGVPDVNSNDTSMVASAATMASESDVTILVLGTDLTDAREGSDATTLVLSDGQLALVEAVAAACSKAQKPLIVVTLTAVPLDISSILSDERIGAVLHVGQPSVQTLGIGDVLFGIVSPAGRTIQTIYPSSYADEVSIFDFNMRPGISKYARPDCDNKTHPDSCPRGTNPGRTHRFYNGKAVVPFGFGLSYTKFSYSVSAVDEDANAASDAASKEIDEMRVVSLAPLRELLTLKDGQQYVKLQDAEDISSFHSPKYRVTVTNNGHIDSDDVVLGFITPPDAGINGVPLQSLFGFERVFVPAGQSVDVYLYPSLMEFARTELDGTKISMIGDYKLKFGVESTVKHGGGYVETSLRAK